MSNFIKRCLLAIIIYTPFQSLKSAYVKPDCYFYFAANFHMDSGDRDNKTYNWYVYKRRLTTTPEGSFRYWNDNYRNAGSFYRELAFGDARSKGKYFKGRFKDIAPLGWVAKDKDGDQGYWNRKDHPKDLKRSGESLSKSDLSESDAMKIGHDYEDDAWTDGALSVMDHSKYFSTKTNKKARAIEDHEKIKRFLDQGILSLVSTGTLKYENGNKSLYSDHKDEIIDLYDIGVYTSLEEGLRVFHHLKFFESSEGESDPQVAIALQNWISKLWGDSAEDDSICKRAKDGSLKNISGKSGSAVPIKYGDKIKLVNVGTGLTVYQKDTYVVGSHDDTTKEMDNWPDKETFPLGCWFYVKGPTSSDKDRWNCNLGEQVKGGQMIRLENVLSGDELTFIEKDLPGDPNFPIKGLYLVSHLLDFATRNFKITTTTNQAPLKVGQQFLISGDSSENYLDFSKIYNKLKKLSTSILDNANQKSSTWVIVAVDSPSEDEISFILKSMLDLGQTNQMQALADYADTMLFSKDKYFGKTPRKNLPMILSDALAKDFVDGFKNTLTKTDFKNISQDDKQVLVQIIAKMRSKFSNFTSTKNVIDSIESILQQKDPSLSTQDSLKGIITNLQNQIDTASANKQIDDVSIQSIKSKISILLDQEFAFLFQPSGFTSLDNLFLGVTEGPNTGVVGIVLFNIWLQNNKPALVDSLKVYSDVEFSNINTKVQNLFNLAVKIDFSANIFNPDRDSFYIKYLEALFAKLTTLMSQKDKDILAPINAYFKAVCDQMEPALIPDRLDLMKKLKVKYNTELLDGAISQMAKSYQSLTKLISRFLYQAANAKTVEDLNNLKKILQNILDLKAEFDFLTGSFMKQPFLTSASSAINANSYLKNNSDSLKNTFSDNDPFSYLLKIQTPTSSTDFIKFLYALKDSQNAQQYTFESIKNKVAPTSDLGKQFSKKQADEVSNLISQIFTNNSLGYSVSDYKTDFEGFLTTRKALIDSVRNIDTNTLWPLTKIDLIFGFVDLVSKYQDFSPDFSKPEHKYGLISLVLYLLKAIDYLKSSVENNYSVWLDQKSALLNNIKTQIMSINNL